MAQLPEKPTLQDLQKYMAEICVERGWTEDTYTEKFLLFSEEVGELAKAMRRAHGLYNEQAKAQPFELAEEFADVFSYLLDMANLFQIDLEQAFREKELLNQTRVWD